MREPRLEIAMQLIIWAICLVLAAPLIVQAIAIIWYLFALLFALLGVLIVPCLLFFGLVLALGVIQAIFQALMPKKKRK
jgi:predicted exporter